MAYNQTPPKTAKTSDTLWGLAIFLTINFLVAAIYLNIINP